MWWDSCFNQPSGTWLILALCSGITLGGVQGPYGILDTEHDLPQARKTNAFLTAIPPAPDSTLTLLVFLFGGHTWQHLGYYRLCTPGRLTGPYGMMRIEPRSATFKETAFPTALSSWPPPVLHILKC